MSPAGTAATPPAQSPSRRLVTIGVGFAQAFTPVVGAWFVGGQQGFDRIGSRGISSRFLPRPGEPAPDFILAIGDDQVVRLSDHRGQSVWLNFWGSWCPPCRGEAPEMQVAFEALAPRSLIILTVALDEPLSDAVAYSELNGFT